ncbi:MAG: serine hydrolase [Pyrinomonadaceae bacterium]
MKNFFAQLAFACLLTLFVFVYIQAQPAPLRDFDAYAEKTLKDWEIPGVAIAVVIDDKIVFAKGYGVKELGKPDKIDEHTIFGVASNSKAFTAAALAMLVDEGKLSWDDKVTKYLPEFELSDPYVTREITIRDLLTHRSGLPAYGGDILWWGGDYSRDEIIRRVRFVKPQSSFRSRYAYQNIPFITAGKIVEQVSGKTWEQFVRERIFAPLGMNETTTSITEIKTTNKTTPHFRDIESGKVIPIAWRNLDAGAPAAGINSNVLDMAKWLRLQINEGKFIGKQLISEKQMREMHSPQMLIPFSNPADQPKLKSNFRAYGFGWNLREYAGYKMVTHGGWTDGQLTQTAFLPEKKLGVVVLSNIHNRDANLVFINRVFDAFLGLEPTNWNAYYLKQVQNAEKSEVEAIRKKETERNMKAKQPLPLSAYAGTYQNDLYGKISFTEENGKLVVRLSHSPTFVGDLEPWQFNTFRVVWRDPVAEKTFLTFVVGENGKVSSVKMAMASFIDDGEYDYKRMEN